MSFREWALPRVLLATTTLAICAAALAAPGDPVGTPFVVDQSTSWTEYPSVAVDGAGRAVVAWSANGNVYYRRYDASGAALGSATKITTSNLAFDPAVAINPDGNFVIAYRDEDGDQGGIFAQMFAWNGSPFASLAINTSTAGLQAFAKVAMDAVGNAVIVWHSNDDGNQSGVFARVIGYGGSPLTGEVRVNQQHLGAQSNPAVAVTPAGDVFVAFQDSYQASACSGYVIRAERLGIGLVHSGPTITVGSCAGYAMTAPAIATGPAGNFVVAAQLNTGSFEGHIVARRFAADGAPLSSQFTVDSTTVDRTPAVAMDKLGGYTVVWPGKLENGSFGAFSRTYAQDDSPRGPALQLAPDLLYPNRISGSVDVSVDDDGDTWVAYNVDAGKDIKAARFKGSLPVDLSVTVTDTADPAHYGENYSYIVYVTNHNDTTQYRVGVASGVVADIVLPPNVAVQSMTGDGWICDFDTHIATCRLDTLEQAAPPITFAVIAPQVDATLEAHASVAGSQDDPDVGNDFDSEGTLVGDTVPDPVSFADRTDVPTESTQSWDAVTISGITVALPVSVTNGSYSINGGAFVEGPGSVSAGDTLAVRHVAAAVDATQTTSYLHLDGQPVPFRSTTVGADTTPDAFSFGDLTSVARSSPMSSVVTIAGINAGASVSIVGGSYSIANGSYTAAPGTVYAGQAIRVRHTSSPDFSTTVDTTLTVGGVSDTFSSTTLARDIEPAAFAFTDVTGMPRAAWVESNAITVSGINDATPISVSGGEYMIDNGAPTAASGTVTSGATIRVRHLTSASYTGTVDTTLTIGGVSDTFSSTTLNDTVPDAFTFQDQADVPVSTVITSSPVTITGILAPAPISVISGSYSIDGGAFTTASGTIGNGQNVCVRHTSSGAYGGGNSSTTLNVGGVTDTFTSSTWALDQAPDAFAFVDQVDVARSVYVISNPVTITGINAKASISVTGGHAYSIDGGPFTASSGLVSNGQAVRVRHVSSGTFGGTVNTLLTVGGVSDTFSSTTLARDVDPDAFAFADRTDVARSTVIISNPVTIAGINDLAPISVAGGEYSINGGAFTAAAGTVASGASVRVRHTTSAAFSGTEHTVLTVGAVSDAFSSTTVPDTVPDAFSFPSQGGVPLQTIVTSHPAVVTGIAAPTPISVSGGSYSIDGAAFTTAVGSIANGQGVRVRHTSSAAYSGATTSILTIGGVQGTFQSTTYALDTVPDAYAFADLTNVALSAETTSDPVTITGINAMTTISVSGGTYSVDGAAWTYLDSQVANGQTVRVRHTSASAFSATMQTILTVGGVTDTFASRTIDDLTPDLVQFNSVIAAPRSTLMVSEALAISGITAPAPIEVANGEYSVDGGPFTTTSGTIANGQAIRVRHMSSADYYEDVASLLTVGGVTGTFVTRTVPDETPDAFDFTDQSVLPMQPVRSNVVTVSGVKPQVRAWVTGQASLLVNGFNVGLAEVWVRNGDTLQLESNSGLLPMGEMNATVTVGTATDTWTVATLARSPLK